eukprot:1192197-Prorocentrum_minimum.AAC.4
MPSIAGRLSRYGVDVNQYREPEHTPLTTAADCGNLEVLKLLIEAGADVNKHGAVMGETPLHFAATSLENAPSVKEIVRALVQAGADVHAVACCQQSVTTQSGQTPLFMAAYCGRVEAVEALIEAGGRT